MGTRSLICVFYRGKFVVAQYTQFDGYLEHQGRNVLEFLRVPGNIQRLRNGLQFTIVADDATLQKLSEEHGSVRIDGQFHTVCKCGAPLDRSSERTCIPPSLNRCTGADILEVIASATEGDIIPIQLDLDFALDGLFCEYCYCVDLDTEVFEAFAGHTDIDPTERGNNGAVGQYRFTSEFPEVTHAPSLLKSFPFAQLPEDVSDMVRQIKADHGVEDSDDSEW